MKLENTLLGHSVRLLPSLGGTVSQVTLGGVPVLVPDVPEQLASNPLFRGRLLFPFCDRLPAARYSFQGKNYQLPINLPEDGCAIHGFVYGEPLEVVSSTKSDDSARLALQLPSNRTNRAGYPFNVRFESTYSVESAGFQLRLAAKNEGKGPAPAAFGWHPYFKIDSAAHLFIDASQFVEVDGLLVPTGRMLDVAGTPYDFRSGAAIAGVASLDIGLRVPRSGESVLTLKSGKLVLQQDPEVFPFIQLYLAPDRQSLAIEPIAGVANSFNQQGLGGWVLEPQQSVEGVMKLTMRR